MMHAFKEIFEDSVRPIPSPPAGETRVGFRSSTIQNVREIEGLTKGLSDRVRRMVMARRAETLSNIRKSPSAAVSRADYKGFKSFSEQAARAKNESAEVLELHDRNHSQLVGYRPIGASQSDHEFAARMSARIRAAIVERVEAQAMLAEFFGDMSAAARERFEFLTTSPDAYADYVDRVKRDNPTIMAYLAR